MKRKPLFRFFAGLRIRTAGALQDAVSLRNRDCSSSSEVNTMINELKASIQCIIEFLLTDLDIALTFMDVAETTEFRGTAERNHQNARNAYDTVVAKLREVTPNTHQQALLDEKLTTLRARLKAVG